MRFGPVIPVLALVTAGCLGAGPVTPKDEGIEATVPYVLNCFISTWPDKCTAWASPNLSPTKAEIDIAVNPKDPMNAFTASKDLDRAASNCVWGVGQVTKDGGQSWKTVYVGGTRAERWNDPTHPLAPWDCVTDPILAFDQNGILYYPLQTYRLLSDGPDCPHTHANALVGNRLPGGCGYSFYLAVSTDGGETFPRDRIVNMALGDGNLLVHDYPRMLVNPKTQTVSTVWNALGGVGVSGTPAGVSHINAYVVSTRDQGRSVDRPAVVSAPESPASTPFASGFAATRDGTVYLTVWLPGATPPMRSAHLAVSTDDARSFGGFAKMFDVTTIRCPLPNTKFRCGTSVELAADTSGGARDGRLYAVWDDGRNGNADVFAAWSGDGGRTWSQPTLVSVDPKGHAQWMPRATVGDDGTVHVAYLDRQFDEADRLYDAVHAWSVDGGETWRTQRVTTISSDGDLGIHQNGFPFIGDYIGIDSVGDHTYLAFPSTALGRAEIAVAHLLRAGNT